MMRDKKGMSLNTRESVKMREREIYGQRECRGGRVYVKEKEASLGNKGRGESVFRRQRECVCRKGRRQIPYEDLGGE